MKSTGIPLPYKIILRHLWRKSDMGRIKIRDVRLSVTRQFRLGKENWNDLYFEMKHKGYIKCLGSRSGIEILVHLKDLV